MLEVKDFNAEVNISAFKFSELQRRREEYKLEWGLSLPSKAAPAERHLALLLKISYN